MRRGIDIPLAKTPLVEGKTKIIWPSWTEGEVLVESKDDITAGDGLRRDSFDNKSVLATETTVNCFALLEDAGIPTHYLGRETDTMFRAKQVTMIPIELVTRRVAFGSFLKRNPGVKSRTEFEQVEFEMFAKNDKLHDPLLEMDLDLGMVRQYEAGAPVSDDTLISEEHIEDSTFGLTESQQAQLEDLAVRTFQLLEAAWQMQDVTLVDMKIECGITDDGEIVVADVIDNDSWRIWPGGDPDQMVDKQLYRDGESLDYVADKYAWVAEATSEFNKLFAVTPIEDMDV